MPTLTIAALSTPQTISVSALECCKNAKTLFVQTAQTPCVQPLVDAGLGFLSMDALYEQSADFSALNEAICKTLLRASENGDVVYAVPGRAASRALMELSLKAQAQGICVNFISGAGFAQAALSCASLGFDDYRVFAASALLEPINPGCCLAVEELDSSLAAGEVKLRLLEYYPAKHSVYFCTLKAEGSYTVLRIPLYELDRQAHYDAATVVIITPVAPLELERFGFYELLAIISKLRSPGGCPWDREQTHESLKKNLIEECYEALEAIDNKNDIALCEELGDVLLQCVLHAEIASEQGSFIARDITSTLVQKLIYRHPHVFNGASAATPQAVTKRWEQLKKDEKRFLTHSDVLNAVPKNLPGLMRANKLQAKASQAGFDWDSPAPALEKLEEELLELKEALGGSGGIACELGDLLFAAVNVARLLGLEPEELLSKACDKFSLRFSQMEALAKSRGLQFIELSLLEKDELWNEVKSTENSQK